MTKKFSFMTQKYLASLWSLLNPYTSRLAFLNPPSNLNFRKNAARKRTRIGRPEQPGLRLAVPLRRSPVPSHHVQQDPGSHSAYADRTCPDYRDSASLDQLHHMTLICFSVD